MQTSPTINGRLTKALSFLKTTAIGGVFFLLPLVVVGVLLGQLGRVVWVVAQSVDEYLPVHTPLAYTSLMAIALTLIVLACFAAGVIARRRIARRFTVSIEQYVLMLFPRYAILKEQLTGNIGGDVLRNQLQPVMVRLPGHMRLGFEVERCGDHADAAGVLRESVTVFLPGSPDPWSGQVVILQAHHVERIASPFGETVATFEQLGRGSQRLVDCYRAANASADESALVGLQPCGADRSDRPQHSAGSDQSGSSDHLANSANDGTPGSAGRMVKDTLLRSQSPP